MKALHRSDLFGWSVFDESRNVDFNGVVWVRSAGNIVIDPMPMSPHDKQHLQELEEQHTYLEWLPLSVPYP